jgi:hypothetical protein
VVVNEFEGFIEILVLSRLNIPSELFQAEFRLGFTVGLMLAQTLLLLSMDNSQT